MLQSTSTFQDDLPMTFVTKTNDLQFLKGGWKQIITPKTNYKHIMSCFSNAGRLKTTSTTTPKKSLPSWGRLHNLAYCKILIKRPKINTKADNVTVLIYLQGFLPCSIKLHYLIMWETCYNINHSIPLEIKYQNSLQNISS